MTDVIRQRLEFPNGRGELLAAALDLPAEGALAFACFAHCFTCSKDLAAASRISRALCMHGYGVLRFDFTGIGDSEGDFGNTDFSSNVDDLVAAADYLRQHHRAPQLLVGHSLGGAAVLVAAGRIEEVRAVATIGAPAETAHLKRLLPDLPAGHAKEGDPEVELGGKRFPITRGFVEDISEDHLAQHLPALKKALLVMHSPIDQVVGIDHARRIFERAKHPKSFVSLDDADHLLGRAEDSAYVAAVLAAWAGRFVSAEQRREQRAELAAREGMVRVAGEGAAFTQTVRARGHRLLADEPERLGGADRGMTPYELLLSALGACTSMTLGMYARRKGWALERVVVDLSHRRVHAQDCADCETQEGKVDVLRKELTLEGALDDAQRQRLLEIAERCPVNRTLLSEIKIESALLDRDAVPGRRGLPPTT